MKRFFKVEGLLAVLVILVVGIILVYNWRDRHPDDGIELNLKHN